MAEGGKKTLKKKFQSRPGVGGKEKDDRTKSKSKEYPTKGRGKDQGHAFKDDLKPTGDAVYEDWEDIVESNAELKETEYVKALVQREQSSRPSSAGKPEKRTLASVLQKKKSPSKKDFILKDFSTTVYHSSHGYPVRKGVAPPQDVFYKQQESSSGYNMFNAVRKQLYAEDNYQGVKSKKAMSTKFSNREKFKLAEQFPDIKSLFPNDKAKKTEVKRLTITDLIDMSKSRQLNIEDNDIMEIRKRFIEMPRLERRQFYSCEEKYRIPEEIQDWQRMGEALLKEDSFIDHTEKKRSDDEFKLAEILNQKVSLWHGDIAKLEVDAIVNSTSSVLLEPRTGVSLAIYKGASSMLDYELRMIWHTYVGDVVDTAGYCLPAKYILHTSGPPGYWKEWGKALKSCYKNSLDKMKELKLRTLAFCCIATGAKGVNQRSSAQIALQTTHDWLRDNHKHVDKIVFCVFEDFQMEIYKKVMFEIFPVVPFSHADDVHLPPEIIRMDTRSKELYIKALGDGKTNVHSIRVMVVGHLDVGKTTLTKRLFGEPVDIEERNSTDGIDVHVKRCWVSLDTGAWEVKAKGLHRDDSTTRLAQVIQKQISNLSLQSSPDNSILEESRDSRFQDLSSLESDDLERRGNAHLNAAETPYDEPDAVPLDKEPASLTSEGSASHSLDQREADTPVMEELKLLVQCKSENARDMSKFADLSIWDFAGQYAFYGTHQIFLSGRAVYLLVIDLSKHIDSLVTDDECMGNVDSQNRMKISEFVQFWLKSIYFYTKEENTVILVGTHVDKLKKEGRMGDVDELFSQLREDLSGQSFSYCLSEHEFAIDNSVVDDNLENLKQAILNVAQSKTKYWGEAIPAKYLTFERELLNRKSEKIMEIQELEKLNQKMSVPLDTKEFDLFLRFQHKCGLLLYFSEEGLKDYVVLDPQWLIDAFKCFITSEKFMRKKPRLHPHWQKFNNTGILTQEFIDQSWEHREDQQFCKHKDHLLRLMEKLDIISRPMHFEAEDQPNRPIVVPNSNYFMPCMLKDQPPKTLLDTQMKNLKYTFTSKLCYTFCPVSPSDSEHSSGFVPPAIFHRLLATCMNKWQPSEHNKKALLFRDCGVFNLDQSQSHQLTLYLCDNFIQIWVRRFVHDYRDRPCLSKCIEVREHVEGFLHKVCDITACSCDDIKTFIKCPQADVFTSQGMIDFTGKELKDGFVCSEHNEEHFVNLLQMYSLWFHAEGGIHEPHDPFLDRLLEDTDIAGMSLRIGHEWKQIGLQLEISLATLEQIEMNNSIAADNISKMLHCWRKNVATYATLKNLKTALVSANADVEWILFGKR